MTDTQNTTKGKLPNYVRAELEDALESATLKNCGVNPEHQEAMKLYIETWIEARIRRILKWDEGDDGGLRDLKLGRK